MKINRENYELYFVDYLDGNLSDYEIRMLEDFLLINPDLRTELEGTEKISLSPETAKIFNYIGIWSFFIIISIFAIWVIGTFLMNIKKLKGEEV